MNGEPQVCCPHCGQSVFLLHQERRPKLDRLECALCRHVLEVELLIVMPVVRHTPPRSDDYEASAALLGKVVRFRGCDAPGTMCIAMKGDGSMVEVLGYSGWFAPHLFELVNER